MVLLHGNLDIVAHGARTTRVSRRKHNAGRLLPDAGCLCWTADPWEADSGYFLSAYAGALPVAAAVISSALHPAPPLLHSVPWASARAAAARIEDMNRCRETGHPVSLQPEPASLSLSGPKGSLHAGPTELIRTREVTGTKEPVWNEHYNVRTCSPGPRLADRSQPHQ